MGLSDWIQGTQRNIKDEGFVQGVQSSIYEARVGVVRRIVRPTHDPEFIFNQDWEVLIILDACRFDLMEDTMSNYEFIDEIKPHTSAATGTTAWSSRNFSSKFEDKLAKTAYVTANPNSITIGSIDLLDECPCGGALTHDGRTMNVMCPSCGRTITGERIHPFGHFDELWRECWNEPLGTLLPDTVTARAIQTKHKRNPERLIVHYNQPHHPFVSSNSESLKTVFETPAGSNIWHELRKGNVSQKAVWDAYQENLRHVLDSVFTLLRNINADPVIITSDHGNAMGEWGIYGHPNPPVPIETLVKVPWIETQAQNTAGQKPEDITADQSNVKDEVNDRLRDLGYL